MENETTTIAPEIVPAQPQAKAISPIESFKLDLYKQHEKQINNYFNGNDKEALKFMSAVVHSIQKNPKLLACSKESLMTAFINCAEYQLYPSTVSGEAFVLPYKNEAQFQLGYKGIVTLAYRSGSVKSITSNIVYKNDEFSYEEGLETSIVHKPNIFAEDRGEPIAVYVVATLKDGEKMVKVMGKAAVMRIKEFSQSKTSTYSPWNEKNDPELHMWRKTCLKQLAKLLPNNETIARALAVDNQESIIAQRQNKRNASNVATALEAPVEPTKTWKEKTLELMTEKEIDPEMIDSMATEERSEEEWQKRHAELLRKD